MGGAGSAAGSAAVDGDYFTCPEGAAADYYSGSSCVIEAGLADGTTTVLGLGSPLFDASFLDRAQVTGGADRDNTKVDAATVYVTLSSNETGIWNPFSWYPYVPTTKWAAIVTERSTVDDVAVLFDRGYGWVYLTSETGFETKSTIMDDLLDDILFECKPICM